MNTALNNNFRINLRVPCFFQKCKILNMNLGHEDSITETTVNLKYNMPIKFTILKQRSWVLCGCECPRWVWQGGIGDMEHFNCEMLDETRITHKAQESLVPMKRYGSM